MKRILKREIAAEFKEQAVAMVNHGRSVSELRASWALWSRRRATG